MLHAPSRAGRARRLQRGAGSRRVPGGVVTDAVGARTPGRPARRRRRRGRRGRVRRDDQRRQRVHPDRGQGRARLGARRARRAAPGAARRRLRARGVRQGGRVLWPEAGPGAYRVRVSARPALLSTGCGRVQVGGRRNVSLQASASRWCRVSAMPCPHAAAFKLQDPGSCTATCFDSMCSAPTLSAAGVLRARHRVQGPAPDAPRSTRWSQVTLV